MLQLFDVAFAWRLFWILLLDVNDANIKSILSEYLINIQNYFFMCQKLILTLLFSL